MTPDNQLQIIGIIVQFTAPILAVLLGWRLNRPKQIPAASEPPSGSQRTGGWFSRVTTSAWLYILFIVVNLLTLTSVIRSTRPLDRWGVISIIIPVASILTNLGVLAYFALLKLFRSLADDIISLGNSFTMVSNTFINTTNAQSDVNQKLSDAIGTISSTQSGVNQKLLDAITAVSHRPQP